MIHLFNSNGWTDYSSITSVKHLRESLQLDNIELSNALAEKMSFGVELYCFIDPKEEDLNNNRVLHHYNSAEEAASEYNYILDSI